MSCGCNSNKKEQYGQVRLDWGSAPMDESHDMGGCPATGIPEGPTPEEVARVSHYKKNMEQRGGNNPYEFENCPSRLRYEVGTGCMNPQCMCHNCQGDCKCNKGLTEGFIGRVMIMGHDLKFWAVTVLVAYLVYKYMSKKGARK